jgi:homocitrate synthase NifV
MNKGNFVFIDRTIISLWEIYGDKLKNNSNYLRELSILLYSLGCSYIEINSELYKYLLPLPKDVKFKVYNSKEINSDEELNVSNDNNVRLLSLDTTILENYEEKFIELLKKYNPYIEMDIKNSIGCSTAMAYEWIKFGGRKVVVSFNGIGNHVPFEELICALRFIDGRDLKTNTKILPKILECYEKITNKRIYLNKAIVGKDIFNVESGIHVDGIFKNPKTYEPFDPAFVGRKRNFIIGKHSGIRSLKIKLGQLQIPIDHINLDNLLTFIREESNSKKRALLDNEIYELCMKVGGYCE